MPPFPFALPRCAALFDDAIRAPTPCADAVAAASGVTARTYAWSVAGARRHSLAALADGEKAAPVGEPWA